MIKIGIHGINGKIGMALAELLIAHKDCELVSASVRTAHAWADKRLDEVSDIKLPLRITSSLVNLCRPADVVIDFTRPEATLQLLPVCEKLSKPLLVGTTGFNHEAQRWLKQSADNIALLLAANTSIGINVLSAACRLVASSLPANQWDTEIFELHHRRKVDAPSGTALKLGQIVAEAQAERGEGQSTYPHTQARRQGDVGYSVARGGEVAGEHTVFFINDYERLELTHRVSDRRIFADGALKAAVWLAGREKGFYSMEDVLALKA